MKTLTILFMLNLLVGKTDKQNFIAQMCDENTLIKKSELNRFFELKLDGFDSIFTYHDNMPLRDLEAFVLQGKRHDTLFDLAIVLRKEKLLFAKETAHAQFEQVNGTCVNTYLFGKTELLYNSKKDYIAVVTQQVKPYRVDSLKEEYEFEYAMQIASDTVVFYPNKNH